MTSTPPIRASFRHNEYLTDGSGLFRVVGPLDLERDGVIELEDCYTLKLHVFTLDTLERMRLFHVR